MDIKTLDDKKLSQLIENRWKSSETVWALIKRVSDRNSKYYECDTENTDRMPDYISRVPRKKHKTRSNRIFRDTESVINSILANPPVPNIIPGRQTPESQELARLQEQYFINKYRELNVKETLRKAFRKLYKSRLLVLKPFWNPELNDFDVISLDPNKVRFSKKSTKEQESEFAIEEVDISLEKLIEKFPAKKAEILRKRGISEEQLLTENPEVSYKEAHIKDYVVFKFEDIILGKIQNPYWDWDGLLVTREEDIALAQLAGQERKQKIDEVKQQQDTRKQQQKENPQEFSAYLFNHFNKPRKPYIFATVLNDDACPIGQTSFIEQAIPLQEALDRRKQQIDENAKIVNGIIKVDSSVMERSEAQKLRFETEGIIYGKGVATGVVREMGSPLPQFVFDDMQDSRNEIDNIMAATSAFRGERQGQETKAGRLALIEQSSLALTELVSTVDYVCFELFNWFYQLAKVNYTETHYAKTMGANDAVKIIELQQNDFEDGTEVRIVPGKTLPEDKQFKYQRAQEDMKAGGLSLTDYLKDAGYDNPAEKARNAVIFKLNAPMAVGISPEEMQKIAPPQKGEPLPVAISYPDIPPDAKIQALQRAGIQANPAGIVAQEKMAIAKDEQTRVDKNAQIQANLNAKTINNKPNANSKG